jgi:2-phospho-L-lactate guanylyltransferase (CobY/MobA/RfbA family)
MEALIESIKNIQLWDAIRPPLLAILYLLAAKYAATFVGGLIERGVVGLTELRDRLNKSKYLSITQFDDFILNRLIDVVKAVKDSYVDKIKKASADGKLTTEEAKEANRVAVELFRSSLSKVELDEVLSILGQDFMRIIEAKVPIAVAAAKDLDKPAAQDPQ